MPVSDRLKWLQLPGLARLVDENRVRAAEYDFQALNLQSAVESEARKQVIERFTPLKIKRFGLACEMCGWVAPDLSFLVLHHQKTRMPFSGLFLQVYGQRDDWDLHSPEQRKFIVDAVVALHREDGLSHICKTCHVLRCHPENRQLATRCRGHLEEIRTLQANAGWRPENIDYSRA